jgi:hypothetical protein
VDGFNEEVSVTEELVFPNAMPVTAMQPRTKNRTRDIVRITIRPSGIQKFLDNLGTDSHTGNSKYVRSLTFLWRIFYLDGVHGFDGKFPAGSGTTATANSFAYQLGGGYDLALVRGFGLRVVEVDYFHSALPNNGSGTQNDIRLAFGVSYHIGRH